MTTEDEVIAWTIETTKLMSQYQFPIVAETTKNKWELIGTCILMRLDNRYFLVTAAHVMNSRHKVKASELYLLLDSEPDRTRILIEEDIVCDDSDNVSDYHDVAIIELIKKNYDVIPDERFLTLEQVFLEFSINKIENIKATYAISGYPRSKNKSLKLHGKNKFYAIYTDLSTRDIFTLSLNYDKKFLAPQGMSGGGIWIISSVTNYNPQLIGVAVSYKLKENHVVAVRISYVFSMIKGFFSGTILDNIDLPFIHIESDESCCCLISPAYMGENLISKINQRIAEKH